MKAMEAAKARPAAANAMKAMKAAKARPAAANAMKAMKAAKARPAAANAMKAMKAAKARPAAAKAMKAMKANDWGAIESSRRILACATQALEELRAMRRDRHYVRVHGVWSIAQELRAIMEEASYQLSLQYDALDGPGRSAFDPDLDCSV